MRSSGIEVNLFTMKIMKDMKKRKILTQRRKVAEGKSVKSLL